MPIGSLAKLSELKAKQLQIELQQRATAKVNRANAKEHTAAVAFVKFYKPESGFVILSLADGATAVGTIEQEPADAFSDENEYRFLGRWEEGKYGPQFKFQTYCLDEPHQEEGVIKYLIKYAKGIGKATAQKLWDRFGPDAIRILRSSPEVVSSSGLLKHELALEASKVLTNLAVHERTKVDLFTLFAGRGLPAKTIDKAIAIWGAKAPSLIRRNPYRLLEISGCGFVRADKLWIDLGHPPAALKRQALFIENQLAIASGDTWMNAEVITEQVEKKFGEFAQSDRAFELAYRSGRIRIREEDSGVSWVALADQARDEQRIADAIARLLDGDNRWPMDQLQASEVDGDGLPTQHQIEQLRKSLSTPVGVFSGGPGTGKTFTFAYLIKAMAETAGEAMAICAPTGKAAVRATQSLKRCGINAIATTIHKLLEIDFAGPSRFRFNRSNPLPYRVLFVDESSMVSADLMADLLDACQPPTIIPGSPELIIEKGDLIPPRCKRCGRPLKSEESKQRGYGPECMRRVDWSDFEPVTEQEAQDRVVIPAYPEIKILGTHILFIGDPYQLPPVGHGAPLRDFIQSGTVGVGELTEVHRNAGMIALACDQIKKNQPFETSPEFIPEQGKNLKLISTKSESASIDILQKLMSGMKRFNPIWETQVIVPSNSRSRLSRKEMNKALHHLLNPNGYQAPGNPFRIGDKIICLKNSRMPSVYPFDYDTKPGNPREYRDYLNSEGEQVLAYVANGELARVIAVSDTQTIAEISNETIIRIPMGRQKSEREKEESEESDEGGLGCSFDLAYAITCHKSQGSEFPCVIVLADPAGSRIASREWWYTAISRASKLCILIGREEVIEQQRARPSLHIRKTFLNELLQDQDSI